MSNVTRSLGAVMLDREQTTRAEMARLLGVSASTVKMWRRGVRRPTYELRRIIFRVYGVPERAWDAKPGTPVESLEPPTPLALERTRAIARLLRVLAQEIETECDGVDEGHKT